MCINTMLPSILSGVIVACSAVMCAASTRLPAPELSVDGNVLVARASANTSSWSPTRRRGVTGTGALFSCIGGYGIFDGPTDEAYRAAMHTWNIEIVRVPMNEDCWLGINGVDSRYGGAAYQSALKGYVADLVRSGFNVILELHWTAAGSARATGQQPMPDKDHAVRFWTGVATAFGDNRAVVFDLFNEPYPDDDTFDSAEAWACWRDGAANCTTLDYTAAGMQDLVSAVRGAGALNVLMLGGICYSNSLVRWVEYMPRDPLQRLAASWHSYAKQQCNNELCWDLTVAPVMKHVPVIVGEVGENDCGGEYIGPLMGWLDAHGGGSRSSLTSVQAGTGTSYLAWLWAPWNCDSGPALITDYNGTCTDSYGCTFRDHLR